MSFKNTAMGQVLLLEVVSSGNQGTPKSFQSP